LYRIDTLFLLVLCVLFVLFPVVGGLPKAVGLDGSDVGDSEAGAPIHGRALGIVACGGGKEEGGERE